MLFFLLLNVRAIQENTHVIIDQHVATGFSDLVHVFMDNFNTRSIPSAVNGTYNSGFQVISWFKLSSDEQLIYNVKAFDQNFMGREKGVDSSHT
ncbi:unnamed protein product [Rhizophagus irregularis]|nr:unnamed protein product [Rhizophagus irregularis]